MASLFGISETIVSTPFGIHENILNDNDVSFGSNVQQQIISTGIIDQLVQAKATGTKANKNAKSVIPVLKSTADIPTPTLMLLVDFNTK